MDERALALGYLQAPPDGLWRWADGGDTLAWHDGTTVAFRAEVTAVLETFAPNGLPPFHAVILLLAACRGKVPDEPARLLQSGVRVPDTSEEDALVDQLAAAIEAQEHRYAATLELLRGVSRFPSETRTGTRAKTVLAETVFETTPAAFPPENAGALVRALGSGSLGTNALNGRDEPASAAEYAMAVHALHEGLKNLTPAALASRQRTGLDRAFLAPAELPDLRPPAERVRRLLAELKTDPEHAGLARVARDILGALDLPRRLSEPEEFALGGVADLANRGSLDRLLLSELAHDDDTLATRVALNEALYLRREPPAAPPPAAFALLLDAGLRMWGVPRVFAAAVALALGAMDARRGSLTVFRAAGAGVATVDLFTAAGLAEHLGALCPEVHPGAAIPAFLDALGTGHGIGNTEAVIVTHRDALADTNFRRALDVAAELPNGPALLLAVVDRAGSFALWPYPPEARTPWCEAKIQMEDLLATPTMSPAAPLLDPRRPADLPVFLSTRPTPLRLPVAGDVDATLEAGDKTFAVVGGRALYTWEDENQGAELVTHGLPGGPPLLFHESDDLKLFIIKNAWHDGTIPLARVNLAEDRPRPEVQRLPMRCPPLGAFAEGNLAFLIFKPRVDVWNLHTGEKLQEIAFPGSNHHWMGGKYFVRFIPRQGEDKPRREWHFLSWEGLLGAMHPVPGKTEDVVAMWDRAGTGHSGPWALTRTGHVRQLVEPAGKLTFAFTLLPDAKVRVSRDGHRLLIGDDQARVLDVVDLHTRRFSTHQCVAARALFEPDPKVPTYPVRRRFEAVCALPASRRLLLRSNKGRLVEFTLGGEGEDTLAAVTDPPHATEWRPFAPLPLTPERGYTLGVAAWANGSRAFLDSRGLLHLKSADLAVPELTVVLTDAVSAAWASTGQRCGHAFFCGDGPLAPAAGMREILDRFIEGTRA